ncbi:MAG: epoxyalkane--coenzyme M transferase, partial [Candidatus Dormibacteraeota bacterium]|nr:epoxyalkane--coenzyme M transferase [Candidatus Dormibacteraeota bacterium]
MQRIQTTHTGSLPRPDDLAQLIIQRDQGQPVPGLPELVRDAVTEVIQRQAGLGLDVVNDGEMGREGYATYVKDRLTGFEGGPAPPIVRADDLDHPALAGRRPRTIFRRPTCNGEVRVKDPDAVGRDLANLKEAGARAGARELFMTAASPGVIALFLPNTHYASREEYLAAIAEAMRHEYRAIVDAGVILQLDCPDLAMGRHFEFADSSLEEFRRIAALNVEALNHAVRDLPPERM